MRKKYALIILSLMILPVLILAAGCGGGAQVAKKGDTVKVDYTGKLTDGSVFDTSIGNTPSNLL